MPLGAMTSAPAPAAAPLGWLVPHHAIRRAAFAEVMASGKVDIIGNARVTALQPQHDRIDVRLEDGRQFTARLAIAADNRFSGCRRAMGIAADQHDFGEKEFLGRKGHFNGEDIIDIIVRQPATPRFIARHMYTFFVADEPQVPAWRIVPPRDPAAR